MDVQTLKIVKYVSRFDMEYSDAMRSEVLAPKLLQCDILAGCLTR
jgi:hypothetical protein